MKYSFSNIKDGSPIIIMMHHGTVHSKMKGNIINLIREDIATISLDTPTSHILKFDHMDLELLYESEDGFPYVWKDAKIVYFKNNYVLQIKGEGEKYNRRITYRVNITQSAQLRMPDEAMYDVIIKDVSLTGFSVLDRNNELQLSLKDGVSIYFEDIDHIIDLYGIVMRLEETNDGMVYGFTTRRSCHDLPSYITNKLGNHGDNIPPSYII